MSLDIPTKNPGDNFLSNECNEIVEDANSMVGIVLPFADDTPPAGWLECNGGVISRTTYSSLFSILGTKYGIGDGSTTFNIPDCRGEFIRGWDHGIGRDPDRASRTNRGDGTTGDNVGTKQGYQIQSHIHNSIHSWGDTPGSNSLRATHSLNKVLSTWQNRYAGGNETRPRNVNVLFCIKY